MSTKKLVERYTLGERIAAGGMGTIYEAYDERLDRKVAVKVLKHGFVEEERWVERFRREARSVAALSHPNLANVLDYGEDEGTHFIVMELAEGRDLARVIREDGPLEPARALRIAGGVCRALHHAHSAGVIHRDIKPANIIVSDDDRVKVTDFGIARASGDSTLTATGSVLGTAHYISPEHASGEVATEQSDVYSLGIVLYEMLTGSLPYTGDSPIAVALRHVSDTVPAPSALAPDTPPEIDDIVRKATEKDPSKRFPSAAALGVAVDDFAAPKTEPLEVSDRPTTVWPIPGDRWDPERLGRIVLTVFLVLVTLVVALVVWRLADRDRIGSQNPTSQRGETRQSAVAPAPLDSPVALNPENVLGQPFEPVAGRLTELGFEVVRVDIEDSAPAGVIVSTEPVADGTTAVQPGQRITLYVSTGTQEEDE